jgi:predicted DNA-binding helix-hairpin-helix protein
MKLYTLNVAEGIFMSSAICGSSDETTKQMLEAVRLLRFKYGFRGYIHFKCLPGTSAYLLKEALLLSDRISVNLEAPTKEHLADIAEQKNYNTDIITRQRWLKEMRIRHNAESKKALQEQGVNINQEKFYSSPNLESHIGNDQWKDAYGQTRLENGYLKFRWDGGPFLHSGQTTQFCLGAAGESDFDILKRLDWEYKEIDLRRGYFSAFSPIQGTPLERLKATPLDREHRLYQTDWLLRIYQYPLKKVQNILTDHGDLPPGDPKVHLARKKFEEDGPIDINKADYRQLLQVPGLGPLSAKRIIALRKEQKPIESRMQLKKIGVALTRADPFITLNGHHQTSLDCFF